LVLVCGDQVNTAALYPRPSGRGYKAVNLIKGIIVGSLVITIVLLVALLLFFWKFQNGFSKIKKMGNLSSKHFNKEVFFSIQKSIPIGFKEKLLVVDFEGKRLLLGYTNMGISCLSEVVLVEPEKQHADLNLSDQTHLSNKSAGVGAKIENADTHSFDKVYKSHE